MANLHPITRGITFSSSHPLQIATDCLDRHTLVGSFEHTHSQPVSSHSSFQYSKMCSTHCQSNRPRNKFLNTKSNLNHQNARLIPLKLGSSLKCPRSNSPSYVERPSLMMISRESGTVKGSNCVPSTRNEWKSAMADVKNMYMNEQHEHCARRCKLLLSKTKDSLSAEPAYRIYLASYLAYSLEIMASTLPKNFSTKLRHFQEALDCYQSATMDVEDALCAVELEISEYYASETTSNPSSARSSVDSVFSQYSSPSSTSSTFPDDISGSGEGGEYKFTNTRRKKKVCFTFSTLKPASYSLDQKDVYQPAPSPSLLDSFPIPPSNISPMTCRGLSSESAIQSLHGDRSLQETSPKSYSSDPYKLNHLIKYRSLLFDSRSQFEYHISTIKRSIDELCQPTINNLEPFSLASEPSEERSASLRGSSRKRFDGSRYQELCERALDEFS